MNKITTSQPRKRRHREYNTVRTDYLEDQIAFNEAYGRYDAVAVLRKLARECGATLREDKIAETKANYLKHK